MRVFFTDDPGIGVKHETFTNDGISPDAPTLAGSNNIDESIFRLLGRITRSDNSDGLCDKPGNAANTMSMMPALPRTHKPK